MAITDTDYLKTIAAYTQSLDIGGSTAEPDSEADVNARLDTDFSTEFGDWYGDAYNFDRNGTAATATIKIEHTDSFPIAEDQTIKITDAFGTEVTYTSKNTQNLNNQQFAGATSNNAIATSLALCINDANATDKAAAACHGGTITASATDNVVTLTQDVEGTDGNKEIDISGCTQDIFFVSALDGGAPTGKNSATKKGFNGGIGTASTITCTILSNVSADDVITLISEAGGEEASAFTSKTYTAKTAESLGSNQFKGNGGDTTVIATSLHDCIINASGHNNTLVISQNANVLTIKQKLAGELGDTAVATDTNTGDVTISSAFTGGRYGFTGIGSVIPGSALMTFTNHATNNNAVIKTALSSAFKSFCKIKK